MLNRLLPVLTALWGATFPTLIAQNIGIVYQTPDQLAVCAADTLSITIQNNTGAVLNGALLDLELPAGLQYQPGSVAGAAESNIINPEKPVLALPLLNPGSLATVTVRLYATCGLVPAINSAQLFDLTLRVRAGALIEQTTTSTFQVQTSLLVITQVDNDSISGEKGQILTRTLHVRNTRLGPVKHLFLRDAHPAGIRIQTPGAATQQDAPTLFTARFDGPFFTAFGDGDEWLEFGETALIVEQIDVLDCGIPSFTCRSNIVAEWSCAAAEPACQGDATYADVVIKESKQQPRLVFQPKYALPWDICAERPVQMSVRVINEGLAPATNIFLQIRSETPEYLGMDKTSFRLITAAGSQTLAPNLSQELLMPECGVTRAGNVTLSIPQLAAKDTLDLLFNTYFCSGACEQALPRLYLNYFYNKPCPVGSFLAADTVKFERRPKDFLGAIAAYSIADCLQDGATYPFAYLFSSNRLLSDSGYLWLKLDVPVGMEWSPDCPPLAGGKTPVRFSIEPAVTDFPVNRVLMAWPLPMPADTMQVNFCLKNTCRADASYVAVGDGSPDVYGNFIVYQPTLTPCTNCGYEVKGTAMLTRTLDQALECAVPSCDSFELQTSCVCDTATGGGGGNGGGKCYQLQEHNTAYRLNYGLPDNDDNRKADPAGVLDMNKVRRDRFWPGDTLRNVMSTKVVCGDSIQNLFYRLYAEVIASDFGYAGVFDTFNIGPGQADAARFIFTNQLMMQLAGAMISIWDSSANTVHTCPLDGLIDHDELYGQVAYVNTKPLSFIDELTTMNYVFQPDMKALSDQGCLPPGFLLEAGDSVSLTADLKLMFNYTPNCRQHWPPLINFETGYSRSGTFYNYRREDTLMFQYTGYFDSLTHNTFGIRPCENSQQVSPFAYNTRIARENLFPYEVRPMARVESYDLVMPAPLTPVSTELLFLNLQENTPILQNVPLPFSVQDTVLHVDFSPAYASPPDEGYALRTRVTFGPGCTFTEPDSSALWITLIYPPCLYNDDTIVRVLENKIGFFSNHPHDTVTTNEPVIDFPTPAVGVELFVKNLAPVPAPNYWIRLVNPEGGLDSLGVVLAPGTPLTPANGIYPLGVLPVLGSKQLRIGGVNTTCDPQRLLVIYGWDCQPPTQPSDFSCGQDTLELLFRPQNPEIELELLELPPQAPLCDSSDYIVFEISNADLGYAYSPYAGIELPAGFQLVPGSSQLAYPSGSAFVSIPDPLPAAGGQLEWNLSALHDSLGARGLPGVDKDPQNALQIRFRVQTECGVVSNAQLVFGARAQWSCGKSTNILRKAGDPLPVEGLTPAYGVQINLSETGAGGPAVCGAQRTLNANLLLSGSAQAGDSICVTLPPGFGYVPGSYQPGANASAGPPWEEGNTLRWPVPPGLPANSLVSFSFSVVAVAPNCSGGALFVQSRQRRTAFCPVINADCAVYVATGGAAYIFPAAVPDLDIAALDVNATPAGVATVALTLTNNSPFVVQAPVFRLYHDLDGDGQWSAADTLLLQGAFPGPLAAGATANVQVNDAFLGSEVCKLVLVLPAAENCACADVVLTHSSGDITYAAQQICTGQSTLVGVLPMPGHTYTWMGLPTQPCVDCAQFLFGPAPAGAYPLTLVDSAGTCLVERHFSVLVGAPPALLTGDTAVCQGASVVLAASAAGTRQWSSPLIGPLNTPSITLKPVQTDTIRLAAVSPEGCALDTSVVVQVWQPDTVDLGVVRTCEGTPVEIFGVLRQTPGLYTQLFADSNGCTGLRYRTLEVTPHTMENRTRCPRETLTIFGKPVTAAGSYCETFASSLGCDSMHCVVVTDLPEPDLPDPDTFYFETGKSVQLPSPGVFAAYLWAPADSLSCTTCASPIASPADTIEYTVTVTTAAGCSDTLVYRVVPYPPCDPGRIKIPNAFTPGNGDEANDVFTVVPYEGVEVIERLTIYNRWGQKIYAATGPDVAWDGTVDGKPAPSDMYVWLLELRCSDGSTTRRHGEVALIR